MRLRSVRWLPSRRVKAQAISTSLTANSLLLRTVKVTRAFEPSPPLRQDCDAIRSPSIGDFAAVAGLASVALTTGSNQVAFGASPMTAAGAGCPSASLAPGTIIHATHP